MTLPEFVPSLEDWRELALFLWIFDEAVGNGTTHVTKSLPAHLQSLVPPGGEGVWIYRNEN